MITGINTTDNVIILDRFKSDFLKEVECNYHLFLRKIIRTHVQDEHTVDDILQDYYLSLLRRSLPRDIQDVKAYLYVSITNQIRDYLKTQKCEKRNRCQYLSQKKEEQLQKKKDISPKNKHMLIEDVEKHLSTKQYEAIHLRYKHQLKEAEVADQMNLKLYTVKKYLQTAKHKLRKVLPENSGVNQ